jgi:endonuclease III
MASSRPPLSKVVALLEKLYGAPERLPSRDVFELILFENAAYLVDDSRRDEVFDTLKKRIGTSSRAILNAPFEKLVAAIRSGGMRPEERANKLLEAATIADEVGIENLRRLMKSSPKDARKVLKRFPGMGDPGADRLLLIAGSVVTIAPESNGLRVLVRLGFAKEDRDYSKTWRAASEAVASELPNDPAWLLKAHLLLRRHGKELCRRTEPRCDICPLATGCAFRSTTPRPAARARR